MDKSPAPSATAELTWSDDGQPISKTFDDVYFSRHNGLEETRYVFLQNNNLPARWHGLQHGSFVIAETGFGTGLNFLTTWLCWLNEAPPHATLHFISVEKYPLNKSDLQRALALWPELQSLSAQLLALYPPVSVRGFHRLDFGQVKLTLIFDDAEKGLEQLLAAPNIGSKTLAQKANWSPFYPHSELIDAWFLDGFAPAKNPEMWTPILFDTLAKLSGARTTFATFTAAGIVKRGLQQAGFICQKVAGYGRKREMLCGTMSDTLGTGAYRPSPCWHLTTVKTSAPCRHVAVIGAGLAGATTASALARAGIKVSVFERDAVASGGSGNAQGVVYSRLSHQPGALAEFNLASFTYALRFYKQNHLFEHAGDACGVLQLLDAKQLTHARTIADAHSANTEFVELVDALKAAKIAGISISQSALWFSQSGWLSPPQVCQKLLQDPRISLFEHCEIQLLEKQQNGWRLHCSNRLAEEFDAVVICAAHQSSRLNYCEAIPGKGIRGQVSQVHATPESAPLQTVLCAQGYIPPQTAHRHWLGATFDLTSDDNELRWQDHADNLAAVTRMSPAFSSLEVKELTDGRASARCATPDYLPIVGAVPKLEETEEIFAGLRHNALKSIDAAGAFEPNLYVNLGHGSRGLTYTPISADIIASLLMGAPLPLPRDLLLHLHPARFAIRNIIKNRR